MQQPVKPFNSLLWLLFFVFVCGVMFSLFSMFIALAVSDVSSLDQMQAVIAGESQDMLFLKIVQVGSSIGMFVLPPIFLGLVEKNAGAYLRFEGPITGRLTMLVALLILAVAMPFIDLTGRINQEMSLPEWLSGLEQWMLEKEQQAEQLTYAFLKVESTWGLIGNLLVIAVVPAIGEELLFRGALQTIFLRWIKNPHVAIWLVAIIFSAIHMQFYGFLPRLVLGALFGYLFYWTKNLWYPILAHFLNNAAAVVLAFFMHKEGRELDDAVLPEAYATVLYVMSMILTLFLLNYIYKHGKKLD